PATARRPACSIRRCATASATTLTSTCSRPRRSGPRACLRLATPIAWARRRFTPPPSASTAFPPASDSPTCATTSRQRKLRQSMGTDVFTWHGFTEVYVDGAWRKATPTFNATLCAKVGVHPLEFDGHNDALLHPFDGAGRTYMQYVNDHGSYHDVPAKFLMREMAHDYANMQGEDMSGRDMEREAAEGLPTCVPRMTNIT